MLECISALKEKGVKDIDFACIHGIFVDDVDQQLVASGLNQLVSCNTIIHESNRLDISELLKEPILALIAGTSA